MNLTILQPSEPTIAYEEATHPEPSPHWTISAAGIEMRRKLYCTWDDVLSLASQMLPYLTSSGSGSSLSLTYKPGHSWQYGQVPNGDTLSVFCHNIEIEPFGVHDSQSYASGANKMSRYRMAVITADYRSGPPDSQLELLVVDESWKDAVELLTVPIGEGSLYWDNTQTDALAADEAPGKLVVRSEWKYTVKGLPTIPSQASLRGRVNSTSMTSNKYGLTFAAGTVMYNDMQLHDYMDVWGRLLFDVTYDFIYDPGEHNKVFKAGSTTRQVIYDSGGTEFPIYPEADLTPLLVTLGT